MRDAADEIQRMIELLAKLPGLGPRSARRATLHLLKHKERVLAPLALALGQAAERITACNLCGNLDARDPCGVCQDPRRDGSLVCVVEDVAGLWALERARAWRGRYHVLGGTLSALDGVGPDELRIASLVRRVEAGDVREVVLALGATIDGQTTADYVASRLEAFGTKVTRLAQGVPIGGELEFLDDGTLLAALAARRT